MSVGVFTRCRGCRYLQEHERVFPGVHARIHPERPTIFSSKDHLVGIAVSSTGVAELRLLYLVRRDVACPPTCFQAPYLAADHFVEALSPPFFQSLLHEEGA